ncbi:MAG: hypothetical protein IJ512_01665, partial [Ruminococcus sp.]|nr:hypothetical protein [Ruminococcus sp.]
VVIEGTTYFLYTATYTEALPGRTSTIPSLKQIYMDKTATNEVYEKYGNTLEILAFTQALQAENFEDLGPAAALNEEFGAITATSHPWTDGIGVTMVSTPEELMTALTDATDAGSGNNTIYITSDIDASELEWTPIKVDGYHGAGVVTVEGCGSTITGLSAPLFAGGFAGASGIEIKNLTIADSDIVSTNTIGSGAFIESVDSMTTISLTNCHLINSTVTGGSGSRTGGLIGWTAGYNNTNDGPVKTYVNIEDCSVIGNTITCDGSVGGIYGHAGNNAWTYSTVTNCTVKDNELISTDDGGWRVGVVVGTANVGELTISNITESGNTLTQTGKTAPEGQSNLYGRFVPDTTGKLVIDGVAVKIAKAVSNDTELAAAIEAGETEIYLNAGTYHAPVAAKGKTLTLNGTKDSIIEVVPAGQGEANGQLDYNFDGSTVTFNGVTIKTNSTLYAGYARLSGTYNNCVIQNTYNLGVGNSSFKNCEFNITNEYLRVGGAYSAVFDGCTFNTDGRAILVYQDGTSVAQTVTVKDCTFNATAPAYTYNNVHHVAAVSIDGTSGTYIVNLEGNNVVDSDFNGLWQIKAGEANVTVNE